MSRNNHRHHRDNRENDNDDNDDRGSTKRNGCLRSCCIWSTFLLGIGLIIGGALWYYLPEDKKSLITVPGFGNTDSPTAAPAPTTPPAPTMSPTPSWQFNQCNNGDGGGDGTTTGGTDTPQPCCQGMPQACKLRADEALYAYVHNAVHTQEDNFLFPWNHERSLEEALQAGYRALELDVSRCDDEIVFYHGLCGLGTRDPIQVLNGVGDFIAQNPTEIIFLFLQMPENANTVSIDEMDVVLQNTNLVNRFYTRPTDDDVDTDTDTPWPTLGELVTNQQNVILFYYNQPNCRTNNQCPSGGRWNYWFQYGMETEFDFSSIAQIDDIENSCTPNYGSTLRDFYRVNSFVTLPSKRASQSLNSYEYAQIRTWNCQDHTATLFATTATTSDQQQQQQNDNDYGKAPNFYAVDFWSQGEVPRFVQDENRSRAAAAAAAVSANGNNN